MHQLLITEQWDATTLAMVGHGSQWRTKVLVLDDEGARSTVVIRRCWVFNKWFHHGREVGLDDVLAGVCHGIDYEIVGWICIAIILLHRLSCLAPLICAVSAPEVASAEKCIFRMNRLEMHCGNHASREIASLKSETLWNRIIWQLPFTRRCRNSLSEGELKFQLMRWVDKNSAEELFSNIINYICLHIKIIFE